MFPAARIIRMLWVRLAAARGCSYTKQNHYTHIVDTETEALYTCSRYHRDEPGSIQGLRRQLYDRICK